MSKKGRRMPKTQAGLFLSSMRLTFKDIRDLHNWELQFIQERAQELNIQGVEQIINSIRGAVC